MLNTKEEKQLIGRGVPKVEKQLIGCGVTEKFIGEIHSERYVGEWMPGRGLSPISRGMDL